MGSHAGKKLCPICLSTVNEAEMVSHQGKMVCQSCASTKSKAATTIPQDSSPQSGAKPSQGDEVLSLNVKVKNLTVTMSGPMVNVGGKGELFVSADGLRLDHNGMEFKLAWDDVRELKNDLQTKHSFDANWGDRQQDARMRVTVEDSDTAKLVKAFQRMPREAIGSHCPYCPGVCLDGICQQCGRRASSKARLSGLLYLIGGAVLGGIGIAMTIASKNAAKPGQSYTVFTGIGAVGLILFLRGLFRLLMGRRS